MKKLIFLIIFLLLAGCNQPNAETTLTTQKTFPTLDSTRYNVAFLITDGVFNTELTAPYDIFQHTIYRDGIKSMNVFTVSNKDDAVITFEGLRLLPDYNYLTDELPKIDILVVPSAEHHLDTDLEDEALINFVRMAGGQAEFITSHCDGAFVLAKAGLLDGVASTTFPSDIGKMRAMFPDLDIRDNTLFVHDGKVITSAGGAKSFEAALYLTEYLYGKEIAQSLAGGLVIDWDVNSFPNTIIEQE